MSRNEHFGRGHGIPYNPAPEPGKTRRQSSRDASQSISDEEHDDNMNFIEDALDRHESRSGVHLLKEGMEQMSGVPMDRAKWRQVANVARHKPEVFESLVWDARKAGIRVKQQRAEARNKRRKQDKAAKAERRASQAQQNVKDQSDTE